MKYKPTPGNDANATRHHNRQITPKFVPRQSKHKIQENALTNRWFHGKWLLLLLPLQSWRKWWNNHCIHPISKKPIECHDDHLSYCDVHFLKPKQSSKAGRKSTISVASSCTTECIFCPFVAMNAVLVLSRFY